MARIEYHPAMAELMIRAEVRRRNEKCVRIVGRAAQRNLRSGGPSGFGRGGGGFPPRPRTGVLTRDMVIDVQDNVARVGFGSIAPHARIHELGGTIRPTSKQALAIPLSPKARARGANPKDFNLVLIRVRGRPFLIEPLKRKSPKTGLKARFMYLLARSVRIPPRSYLARAAAESLPEIRAEIARPLGRPRPAVTTGTL